MRVNAAAERSGHGHGRRRGAGARRSVVLHLADGSSGMITRQDVEIENRPLPGFHLQAGFLNDVVLIPAQ